MIGILLIYFIWKRFSDLAFKYGHKKKWVYGLLGVASYYIGTIFVGFILGLFVLFFDFDIDFDNTVLMSTIGLPFGILACYLTYLFLEKRWKKEVEVIVVDSIDDIGKNTDD
jgi:hypothetical protein